MYQLAGEGPARAGKKLATPSVNKVEVVILELRSEAPERVQRGPD